MGRELKRVSIDFEWPRRVVWKGYINPYRATQCETCKGSGYNPETKKLSDTWYTHLQRDGQEGWGYHLEQDDVQALVDAGRLFDFTRVPRTPEQEEIVRKKIADGGNSWLPESNGYVPTAAEVNAWSRQGMGHDAINRWICVEARAKRLGVYGHCSVCGGKGEYWCEPKYAKLADAWEPIEPPTGDGYQLWKTTSDGSPVSPVFEDLDALCEWCAERATTFGSDRATAEQWRQMLDDDFVFHQYGNHIFI